MIMVVMMIMMICTPSLDDRWEGLDGHWLGEDTINPFTPPAPPAHSSQLLPQPTTVYKYTLHSSRAQQ